jgi:hypothetical protein
MDTHFIASDWIQKWGNTLIEEIKEEGEVDYECPTKGFYIMLL